MTGLRIFHYGNKKRAIKTKNASMTGSKSTMFDDNHVESYINKYNGMAYVVEYDGSASEQYVAPPVFDDNVTTYKHTLDGRDALDLVDRFLSKVRYGNYVGAAYGGGVYSPGADPVDMQSPVKDEFDAVARTHDFEYYLVERQFLENKITLGEEGAEALRARNLAKADQEFVEAASGVKADTIWGEATRLVGIWALSLHSHLQAHTAERIESRTHAMAGNPLSMALS